MYNHIAIDTIDDSLDFFNVKSFDFNEELQMYELLSQNNEYHFFQKKDVNRIIM